MEHKEIIKELEDIRSFLSSIIFNLEDEISLEDYYNLIILLSKVINLEYEFKCEFKKEGEK